MRVLIVKLSSLGDVVHALPVVADIHAAHADAQVDWVVEPAFAPLLERTRGVQRIVECPLRHWARQGWLAATTRRELRAFAAALRDERYDAVVDLQGLTKSALVARLARGPVYGLANRTRGASHEWPARALATTALFVEPESHALDRSRELVSLALGTRFESKPDFGVAPREALPHRPRDVVFVHGTSRADKLWPDERWVELGRRLVAEGWRIALPRSDAAEQQRAERIAAAIAPGEDAVQVWPAMPLGALIDRMAAAGGAIGVDSGPSHIATALGLPHVQIYNHPTAWRTGPRPEHGHSHQVAVEAVPAPEVDVVHAAWRGVAGAAA